MTHDQVAKIVRGWWEGEALLRGPEKSLDDLADRLVLIMAGDLGFQSKRGRCLDAETEGLLLMFLAKFDGVSTTTGVVAHRLKRYILEATFVEESEETARFRSALERIALPQTQGCGEIALVLQGVAREALDPTRVKL